MTDALTLLHASLTPDGFVASPTDRTNYRHVWARDGVICGLAGLVAGDDALADGLRQTLRTLAAHVGPQGQIPSNVAPAVDGRDAVVSYGGLAGRVDAGPWFVLGAAHLVRATGDRVLAARLAPVVDGVFALLDAWEVNARGLVYVPQSGDWADEYDLHGYLLYDQALRIAALRAWHAVAPQDRGYAARADGLAALVEPTFWPDPGTDPDTTYHPAAARRLLAEGPPETPVAALAPGGYTVRFDGFGTAVALGLAGIWADRASVALDAGQRLADATPAGLVPAFWPPVRDGDAAWGALRANVRDTFSNHPGHYHNGGLWPVVNGWWAVAQARHGRAAAPLAARIEAANAAGDFPEYLDAAAGQPRGTPRLAWSAAASVLARAAASGAAPLAVPLRAAPAAAGPPPAAGTPEVVVAGEVLVDLLSTVPSASLVQAAAFERHPGGSAANVATNLARLRVSTVLIAAVGDDGFGRFLRDAALSTGVDARLRVVPDAPTSVVTVTRTAATPDFALYRHADRMLEAPQLPDALLGAARLFHTSGFALSREPARTTLLDAAARASRLGTALSVDLNVAPRTEGERAEQEAAVRTYLALGPLAKVSRDDAARLFGETLPDAEAAARLQSWGACVVCLTRGAAGAHVAWDGGTADVAAPPVDAVVDATGAGDAFWAGFVAAWLVGQDPPACARAGGRLAALKLGRAGPLPDDVDAAPILADPA